MRKIPTLIGITGHAGAGKSTVAATLVRHGFVRMRFADTLKNMLRCLGLTEAEIDGDLKELPCKALGGRTPRFAMQTLGTEWGRDTVHYNLWVDAAMSRFHNSTHSVVFDDVRFGNEALAIRNMGGEIWRVTRGNPLNMVGQHASEVLQDQIRADRTITNSGSLARLALVAAIKLGYDIPEEDQVFLQ